MARGSAESLARTESEIVSEKAAALRRIAERLEGHLLRLERLAARVGAGRGAERTRAVAAHDALLRTAELWRWYLIVQREANGIIDHRDLDRIYPMPRRIDRTPPTRGDA